MTAITITGWTATNPEQYGAGSTKLTKFRFAHTPRWFDREAQEFRNGETQWFDVHARGQAGDNIVTSVIKGQPLVVTGRLKVEHWPIPNSETVKTTNVINATAIGHDLTKGTATFERAAVSTDDEAVSDWGTEQ